MKKWSTSKGTPFEPGEAVLVVAQGLTVHVESRGIRRWKWLFNTDDAHLVPCIFVSMRLTHACDCDTCDCNVCAYFSLVLFDGQAVEVFVDDISNWEGQSMQDLPIRPLEDAP